VLASHYSITNKLGGTLAVLSATLTNGTNVILITGPRAAGHQYVLVVNGLRDVSAAANPTVANGHIGIDQETLLFTYNWVWRYDESGANLQTAWRDPAYDDSAWPSGLGLLGFESGGAGLPVPILTTLRPPELAGITDYFRTRFNFAGDLATSVLRLRHAIDDGAVFYLNGEEVHRIRVPEGQNYTTLSPQAVETQIEGPFILPTTALVSGNNVLAAEVHQNVRISEDVVFGAELVQAFPATPSLPVGPNLVVEGASGGFSLGWDASDFALEQADSPAGPWKFVPNPTLPHVVLTTSAAKFYRLTGSSTGADQ
jgi:hypothetical protein